MNFGTRNKIFILGAGSSVDYGLPLWSELNKEINKKLLEAPEGDYVYKKEMVEWVDKVGVGKKYSTIDECIYKESDSDEYSDTGFHIEQELFSIMEKILIELYKDNNSGWIKSLNEIIKYGVSSAFEKRMGFINYNYDCVFDNNLINYKYLTTKRKENEWERLEDLSGSMFPVFYPHGTFSLTENINIVKHIDTKKHGRHNISTVTCHDSKTHNVSFNYNVVPELFILGLGGGMSINLEKLSFSGKVASIHVTIFENIDRENILDYLMYKFDIQKENIFVYNTCSDLVEAKLSKLLF